MTISIVDHRLPHDTHNTYDVVFFACPISTTVTHDPATVIQWIYTVFNHNLHSRLTIPRRHAPALHRESLPHLSAHLRLVFLIEFLSNPNHCFVGVGIKADLEKLQQNYGFGFNVNFRDWAAQKYGRHELRNTGLKGLARVVMGKEMSKPKNVTMSRWDNRWLTPTQVQYACVDAFVSFEIGRILSLYN